jgi:hypothetical protein
MIGQIRNHTPIIGLQEVLERQASKELMLRELLRIAGMGVEWQHALSSAARDTAFGDLLLRATPALRTPPS